MADEDKPAGMPSQVAFHYVKSTQFRVIHCDGIIGGLTPAGDIHFALYSERPAIPQMVIHQVEPDGQIGKVEQQIGRGGIVRELEMDVMIDRKTARALRDWLSDREQEAAKFEEPNAGPRVKQ